MKKRNKQLYKDGLRKCCICKQIFKLSSDNFYKDKNRAGGFMNRCKNCEIKRDKTLKRVAQKRRYNKIHSEKIRLLKKKRRLHLRFKIFKKDNFTCQYCGRKAPDVELQVDHKYPVSKGGLNKIENYITACSECNVGKCDYILDEFTLDKGS